MLRGVLENSFNFKYINMGILNEIESHKKKKSFTKIIIIFILVLIGGYSSYGFFINNKSEVLEKEINTFTMTSGDLKTSISGDGKILYKEDYNLNFPISGTVTKLLKNEGDVVKTGEIIASLDTTYLSLAVDKAIIALKKANSDLELKKNQYTSTDIKLSENQLDLTKASLDNTKIGGEIDINNAKNAITSSEITLESAKIDLDVAKTNLETIKFQEEEKYNNVVEDLFNVVGTNISFNKDMLFKIDELLGVTPENKDKNNNIEYFLGAKDTVLKKDTLSIFRDVNNNFLSFLDEWKVYKDGEKDSSKINYFLDKAELNTKNTNKMLGSTLETIKNSISSVGFTQDQIDSYVNEYENSIVSTKKEIQNLIDKRQNVLEQKTLLDSKILAGENLVISFESKYEAAKQKLIDSKLVLENSQKKLDNNLILANKQVEISETSLLIKQEGTNSIDLAPYYINIESAQKSLEEAKLRLEDAVLKSPIDGKIVKINGNIGSFVGGDKDTSFVTITNNNKFYVESYVEELDITRIINGAKVYLTFDALDGTQLEGNVYYISDKSTTDNNGVVTYKVEIKFEHADSLVREGMTTYIEFITNEVKNVKIIPVGAVKPVNGVPSVQLENGNWKTVITGFTDSKMVEIISGLEKGDKIIY